MKSNILSDSKFEHIVPFKDQIKKAEIRASQLELNDDNETINFENLNKKIFRIKYLQRKNRVMFSSSSNEDSYGDETVTTNQKIIQNKYCKTKCSNCIVGMSFRLNEIDEDINKMSLENILNELKKHGHAKYKKINGKNRTKIQAQEELKHHLLNNHRKKTNKIID